MTDSLSVRVLHSWMNNLRIEYIAAVEKVSVEDVKRIVDRACSTPSGRLNLDVRTG